MDLDGTITRKDSMFAFIKHSFPSWKYYTGLVLLSPVMAMNRLGLFPSTKTKEILLGSFFRNLTREQFEALGDEFSRLVLPGMIRKEALKEIAFHQNTGATIVVVTASLSVWCETWCRDNGFHLIATDYEVANGKVTGRIRGKNCKGPEKVRRIRERYHLESAKNIYAYGDSKSDLKMLGIADIKYYKWEKYNDQ